MFGISLGEIAVVALVVLLVVGPQKLPGMLRTFGEWMHKLRRMTTEVRAQTGIDDILREEGIEGGLSELRTMLRGDWRGLVRGPNAAPDRAPLHHDPYAALPEVDRYREYPPEGADSAGAIPDDLIDDGYSPIRDAAPTQADDGDGPVASSLDVTTSVATSSDVTSSDDATSSDEGRLPGGANES